MTWEKHKLGVFILNPISEAFKSSLHCDQLTGEMGANVCIGIFECCRASHIEAAASESAL